MFDKVRDILAEQLRLDPDKITPNAEIIADLGADSLDLYELVMTLEEEYSMEIPPEELQTLNTVGDVIEYLKAHGIEE